MNATISRVSERGFPYLNNHGPFHMMWPFTECKGGSKISTCMSCLVTPDKMWPIISGTLIPSTLGWLIPSNQINVFFFICSLAVVSVKHFVTIVIQVTKQKTWTKNRVVLTNAALLFLPIKLFFPAWSYFPSLPPIFPAPISNFSYSYNPLILLSLQKRTVLPYIWCSHGIASFIKNRHPLSY